MEKMCVKIMLTLLAGMLLGNATAQSLRGFNYQAVARDAAGNLLANQNATVVFDIRQGSAAGALIYQETHNTNTNAYGLINLVIGKGNADVGNFASIDWSANDYFLGVTLNGSPLGASALEAVPYSKVATDMDLDQLSDVNTSGAAPGQVLNIGSGESRTIAEVAVELGAALGRSHLGPDLTGEHRVGDIRHCYADIDRARAVLGFEPQVSFADGLAELTGWLDAQVAVDRVSQARRELAARGLSL